MVHPALIPLIRTPRLPVVDWTEAPADLNGLVRFAEKRNLLSARVPSHFKRNLLRSVFFSYYLFIKELNIQIRLGVCPVSCSMGTEVFSRRMNRPGREMYHWSPSRTVVKEQVELYLHCLCVPWWLAKLSLVISHYTILLVNTAHDCQWCRVYLERSGGHCGYYYMFECRRVGGRVRDGAEQNL